MGFKGKCWGLDNFPLHCDILSSKWNTRPRGSRATAASRRQPVTRTYTRWRAVNMGNLGQQDHLQTVEERNTELLTGFKGRRDDNGDDLFIDYREEWISRWSQSLSQYKLHGSSVWSMCPIIPRSTIVLKVWNSEINCSSCSFPNSFLITRLSN